MQNINIPNNFLQSGDEAYKYKSFHFPIEFSRRATYLITNISSTPLREEIFAFHRATEQVTKLLKPPINIKKG